MRIIREGPTKITRSAIDAAWRRRAAGLRTIIGDFECRGLTLIVNATSMSWVYSYKPRGVDSSTGRRFATKSLTIGNPETHSPDHARTAANEFKGRAKAGFDPAADRKAGIEEAADRRGRTVERLVTEYARVLPSRRRLRGPGLLSSSFAKEEISHLRAAAVATGAGRKPIKDVEVADIRRLLRADPDHPNAARHRFAAIRRFFDWCHDEGMLSTNPCAGIAKARRPRTPASRAHCLSMPELAALWRAAEALPAVHRDFVRMLIAIPCRRGEAATLDWGHVDLASATWSQPGHLTKNRESHRLHLHPLALEILRLRREAAGKPASGLVFPAPRSSKAITTFSAIRGALREAAPELVGWRLHDMRRSFATALGEAGVSETIADAILNHRQAATRAGVLGVYQRSTRWPEQVAAMQHWGRVLGAALDGRGSPDGEVVPFPSTSSGQAVARNA
jgi:integrase